MLPKKKEHPKEKVSLHPRNKHRERYNFKELTKTCPELAKFVSLNKFSDESIDFFNPKAVMMLNKALLKHFYNIDYWEIPSGYLCPPIPGRADYIHYIADLLGNCNQSKIPSGKNIKCLDIGVGANCIYPIIGVKEYSWSFVGSDIESEAIHSATEIIERNSILKENVELRLQTKTNEIFNGIIEKNDFFDVSICNPPFHSSFEEAKAGTLRKLSNLKQKEISKPILNFGGQNKELWCEGGEEKFIENMIFQSKNYSTSCFWFTTLVSKQAHLDKIYVTLKQIKVEDYKTMAMNQGNKSSRIVAWSFLNKEQQRVWVNSRWNNKP